MTKLGYSTVLTWMIAQGSRCLDVSGSLRLLLSETDYDIDLSQYNGSSEGFSQWQQIVDPLYYECPFEERASIVTKLWVWDSAAWPSVARKALSLGPLPPLAYCHADSAAEYVLHRVANVLGISMYYELKSYISMGGGHSTSTVSRSGYGKVRRHANQ